MSKQTTAIKTANKPSRLAAANGHNKLHRARATEEELAAAAKFMEAYREWQQTAHRPAKRRAYIRNVINRIAEEFKPEKIILFGSYAYGKPTPESDVDLLVVMPFEDSPYHQAHRITMRLDLTLPMDLLVRTPEQLQYRLNIGDSFMREIVERGKVMYEAHNG